MKKLTVFLGILLFGLLITQKGSAQNNRDNLFIGNKILDYVKSILDFGTREPDSKGNKQTQNYIKDHLSANQKIAVFSNTFVSKTPIGKKEMHNIWAVINPTKEIKKTVVLAAHYDSKYFSPGSGVHFLGADDGLSGVATLLAMSWFLQVQSFNHTQVILLFLDGEEAYGDWSDENSLYGSRYQAQYWNSKGSLKNINSFILLDMVGNKSSRYCIETNSNSVLIHLLFRIAHQLGYGSHFRTDCSGAVGDDHTPFSALNVKVADIIPNPFPSYWHTPDDTLDKLDSKSLTRIFNIMLTYLLRGDYQLKDANEPTNQTLKDSVQYDNEVQSYDKGIENRPVTRESYVKSVLSLLLSENNGVGHQTIGKENPLVTGGDEDDENDDDQNEYN